LQEIASSGEKYYSKNLHSRFKVQSSEKTSSIPPGWIQDSRFKAQKNIFNPTSLDSRFKIQGSEKTSSVPPVWTQDSIFKAEGLRIQKVFLGS
jgi:cytochrome c556